MTIICSSTAMPLLKHYQERCKQGDILEDPHQLDVLNSLQHIHDAIIENVKSKNKLLGRWRTIKPITGLYLYGSVGTGKTFMMDCFYVSLPIKEKMRMHFHAFMRFIHQELIHLQGKKNPLELIAKQIAKKAIVLCFDEFIVNDITDAMLLARLLDALFKENICLITTSNTAPDDLYLHGLQRSSFLPAIALLKKHTTVMYIKTDVDYRLRYLKDAGVFYIPNDEAAHIKMEKTFHVLSHDDTDINEAALTINGRQIPVIKTVEGMVWFEFNVLCAPPRSQHDYLELAKHIHTLFISNVTPIPAHAHNKIVLFIRLIDVLYDHHIKLILSSEVPITDLYPDGRFREEFKRTCSRLLEMQSEAYLRDPTIT